MQREEDKLNRGGSGGTGGGWFLEPEGEWEQQTRGNETTQTVGHGGATGGGQNIRGRKEGTKPSEEPGRQGRDCEKDKDRQSG
eukprot:2379237-Pyramimonas_sp.AAC.1